MVTLSVLLGASGTPSVAFAQQSASDLFWAGIDAANKGKARPAAKIFEDLIERFPTSKEARRAQLWIGDIRVGGFKFLRESGKSSNRVDLMVMSEAYTESSGDRRRFTRLAADIPDFLDEAIVYDQYASYFNLHEVYLVSKDDRLDYRNKQYDTALNGRKLGSVDQASVDERRVAEFLSALPYEDGLALVIAKSDSQGTGSGNRGVAVVSGEPNREEVMRVMGYAFGGLAAEFSSSEYVAEGLPREAVNVSKIDDKRKVPWAHWIKAMPSKIGVYEGGAGAYKDVFRPTADGCIMRGGRNYCVVCREAVMLRIYERVCPIDEASPNELPIEVDLKVKKGPEIWVQPMHPKHSLDVAFTWRKAEGRKPAGLVLKGPRPEGNNPSRGSWDRKAPEGESIKSKARKRDGVGIHAVDLGAWAKKEKLEAGRYWVTARVHDPARVKGKPWVLKDPLQLLSEVITWEVVVKPGA